MKQCFIKEKIGLSISYELYDEVEKSFIMSCALSLSKTGNVYFLNLKDSHLYRIEDLAAPFRKKLHIGIMKSERSNGPQYELYDSNENKKCKIRYSLLIISL